jgi:hypothetical protein
MNLQTIPPYGSAYGDNMAAPLHISDEELRRMDRIDNSPPFEVGDKVVAKLLPVDAEAHSQFQVNSSEPLTVCSVRLKSGQKFLTRFVGTNGTYDACFFKKMEK